MNKTIVIMGWMSSGKDTAIQYLSNNYNIPIAISNTTRPRREGELQGREYNFVTKEEFDAQEYPIPPRVYHTIYGDWYYGTDPLVKGKLVILDFAGCKSLCNKLRRENVIVIKLKTSKSILKRRAIERGDNLDEICRRIADDEDVFKGSDEYADYIIQNNDSEKQLYGKLDNIMSKIKGE